MCGRKILLKHYKKKGEIDMNQELYALLAMEEKETERILRRVEKELKKLPDGRLEVSQTGGKYKQFIRVRQEDGVTRRTYIPKKEIRIAEQLAQKEYDIRVRSAAKKLKAVLAETVEALKSCDIAGLYEATMPARRRLIIPTILSDEQYIAEWYETHPGGGNSHDMITSYTTLRGEKVRSKSEKMIADAYFAAEIPYVYEPALHLRSGKTLYPDFAVLNISKRRTLYHEHFGLMDDEEYRSRCIRKMRKYNDSGFWCGDTMIYTFEGEDAPFDQDELERIMEEYLR